MKRQAQNQTSTQAADIVYIFICIPTKSSSHHPLDVCKINFPSHKYDLQDFEIRLIEICVYITAILNDPHSFVSLVSTIHK